MPFFIPDDPASSSRGAFRVVSSNGHGAAYNGKLAVCPPQLFTRTRPAWQRWLTRVWARATGRPVEIALRPAATRIQKVRERFLDLLSDLGELPTQGLVERIEKARSLRELWHLRPEAYDLLSRFGGQSFAQQRLEALNADFPMRVPQAGHCRPDSGRTVAW